LNLYELNPLTDPRWTDLVDRSEQSSIFHTREWLDALRRTYEYEAVVFTDAAPGRDARNALLFCRVNSWLTGRRLVSLPFSDHCEPLVEREQTVTELLDRLAALAARENRLCLEVRPRRWAPFPGNFVPAQKFSTHSLDLSGSLEQIFAAFHKSCVQRAIRRAERTGIRCEAGNTGELLGAFYALNMLTRRRHRLPSQPRTWFRNLKETLGDRLRIYVASDGERPIAAMLVVTHRRTLIYKYGCSDHRYKRLGATPLLFWTAIQDAKKCGVTEFDLGRSDLDNPGLIAFKDRLGARRESLTYFRCSPQPSDSVHVRSTALARRAYSLIPNMIRDTVGSRLYGHFG
jgi:CelD/BcsL family acetyltransferase involved in cellulose biosynthesis